MHSVRIRVAPLSGNPGTLARTPTSHRLDDEWVAGLGTGHRKPDSVHPGRVRPGRTIISLGRVSGDPRPPRRSGVRLIPGFIPRPEPRGRTGGPFTLFCLAPHGVFPAPSVTLGAVSSYLAISPLPSFARRLERAVSFLRHFPSPCHYDRAPRLSPGMLPCGVRTFLSLPKEAAIISGPFQDGKVKREGRVAQCLVRLRGNQGS